VTDDLLLRTGKLKWLEQPGALFQPVVLSEDRGCQCWKLVILLPSPSPLSPPLHDLVALSIFCSIVISDCTVPQIIQICR